jgi:hypothetical protein
VASLLASAGVEHARLRLSHRRDRLSAADLLLFFISLATRRVEYVACTPNPDGRWVAQQARNLVMQLGAQQPFRLLVHDRDSKFSHPFDDVFLTEGIRVIRTPVQAPNANAHAERWVRTLQALSVSTESSFSADGISSAFSASTAATTTSTGRTARLTSSRPMAAIRRR